MADSFPLLPVSQEQLKELVGAMLVYKQYRFLKTQPTEERWQTLLILECLIPKLYCGVGIQEGAKPLWLTVDDVRVMKIGLATLLDQLNKKPRSPTIEAEMQRLKKLKTAIEQTFKTTQD